MPTVLTVKNLLKSGALVLIGREVEHVLHTAERALPIALLAHVALLKLVAVALHVTGPLAAMHLPACRLSRMRIGWPPWASASTVWDPMKPAPPAMSTVFSAPC